MRRHDFLNQAVIAATGYKGPALNTMKKKTLSHRFDRFAGKVAKATGSSAAFLTAFALVIIWAVTGPVFQFSETWQLVINTGTTIITFLMVFLIQRAQNKDTAALQLKLDELIAATKGASNRIINIEDLEEDELETIKKFYAKLYEQARKSGSVSESHSIGRAEEIHAAKSGKKISGAEE